MRFLPTVSMITSLAFGALFVGSSWGGQGDVAVVTSPFELFTDYGMRIQARSRALLTLNVQLACQHSGYLPTARALRGGGYSADQYLVGPEGGRVFVERCVREIDALWAK